MGVTVDNVDLSEYFLSSDDKQPELLRSSDTIQRIQDSILNSSHTEIYATKSIEERTVSKNLITLIGGGGKNVDLDRIVDSVEVLRKMNMIMIHRSTSLRNSATRDQLKSTFDGIAQVVKAIAAGVSTDGGAVTNVIGTVSTVLQSAVESSSSSADHAFHDKVVTIVESTSNDAFVIAIITVRSLQSQKKSKWGFLGNSFTTNKDEYEIGCSVNVLDVEKVWFLHEQLFENLMLDLPRIITHKDETKQWQECVALKKKLETMSEPTSVANSRISSNISA